MTGRDGNLQRERFSRRQGMVISSGKVFMRGRDGKENGGMAGRDGNLIRWLRRERKNVIDGGEKTGRDRRPQYLNRSNNGAQPQGIYIPRRLTIYSTWVLVVTAAAFFISSINWVEHKPFGPP